MFILEWEVSPSPQGEIENHVEHGVANNLDIHVHAWNHASLRHMLDYLSPVVSFDIGFSIPVVNENIAVLRKR